MIGNVMVDARSTGKYYHFVRLIGRVASHITLECALQTHPNVTLVGEEVVAKKLTLKSITDYIADTVCKRAELGYNYGVILIPEGLIDFIPEIQQLIAELNEILASEVVDEAGQWKKNLKPECLQLFEFLPSTIQEQLMLERDPHGNVQVAKIETEKMLIQMVETELEKRKEAGSYKGQFKGQPHFFGTNFCSLKMLISFGFHFVFRKRNKYEGRCGLPSNFDATYCYALGFAAGVLLHSGKTGLISSVGNLAAPVQEWTVGGTPLTSLMDVERRHGRIVEPVYRPPKGGGSRSRSPRPRYRDDRRDMDYRRRSRSRSRSRSGGRYDRERESRRGRGRGSRYRSRTPAGVLRQRSLMNKVMSKAVVPLNKGFGTGKTKLSKSDMFYYL